MEGQRTGLGRVHQLPAKTDLNLLVADRWDLILLTHLVEAVSRLRR